MHFPLTVEIRTVLLSGLSAWLYSTFSLTISGVRTVCYGRIARGRLTALHQTAALWKSGLGMWRKTAPINAFNWFCCTKFIVQWDYTPLRRICQVFSEICPQISCMQNQNPPGFRGIVVMKEDSIISWMFVMSLCNFCFWTYCTTPERKNQYMWQDCNRNPDIVIFQ